MSDVVVAEPLPPWVVVAIAAVEVNGTVVEDGGGATPVLHLLIYNWIYALILRIDLLFLGFYKFVWQ